MAAIGAGPAAAVDEAAKLADARERWARQDALDYTFRLRVACFCPERDPVRIRVRDGKPRGTPRRLREFDTVEELFDRIAEELARRTEGPTARYSKRTGAPRWISADPLPRAVDDEYVVTVRRLRITRRD